MALEVCIIKTSSCLVHLVFFATFKECIQSCQYNAIASRKFKSKEYFLSKSLEAVLVDKRVRGVKIAIFPPT
jgi:hypothetical protein